MANISADLELINQQFTICKELGLAQVKIDNITDDGKTFVKNNKKITYFTSCSYIGLENDPRLKKGSIDAINTYGVQFSSSRAYLEIPLYSQIESYLVDIFNYPTLLAPTTSLGHMSLIPLFIDKNDVVILDQQVHSSVQSAVGLVRGNGTQIEYLRHNRIDLLESRVKKLSQKYRKVWYMADSVYSMYGDVAPVGDIHELLNLYENFYCYLDDAHGMSWEGMNGSGYVFSRMPYHEKLIYITTLAKGFGVAGSAMVLHSEEEKQLVRNLSPAFTFSGPIQPSNLGAMVESAKIHLSPEIYKRQAKVKELIRYFILTAKALNLPLINDDRTPIFFIAVGSPNIGFEVCKRMLNDGYYLNIASYPAVSLKNTGIRITVTHHLNASDIFEMLTTLAFHLEDMEKKNSFRKEEVFKIFPSAY